jgi:hypothetical protein
VSADSGQIPACLFVFEGDKIRRAVGAAKDGKRLNHNTISRDKGTMALCVVHVSFLFVTAPFAGRPFVNCCATTT